MIVPILMVAFTGNLKDVSHLPDSPTIRVTHDGETFGETVSIKLISMDTKSKRVVWRNLREVTWVGHWSSQKFPKRLRERHNKFWRQAWRQFKVGKTVKLPRPKHGRDKLHWYGTAFSWSYTIGPKLPNAIVQKPPTF